MNRKFLVLMIIGSIILVASGCGGGGGGSGRYTLPGEIPTSGTGSGGGDGGGGTTETDPDSMIASAWEDYKYGAYSSAIGKFNQVLSLTSVTESQKAESYNGLGWSLTKSSGVSSAISAFTQGASLSNEAKIGLAAALIQRGEANSLPNAIQAIRDAGIVSTSSKFTPRVDHPIGISNAEVHAMLAFCYFWTGDKTSAASHLTQAHQEDPASGSPTDQIYQTLVRLGVYATD